MLTIPSRDIREADNVSTDAALSSAPDLTLNAEVRRICVTEGGYPARWLRHASCPCCGLGELASLFTKYQFNHDQCDNCGFVCVNPYPPVDIIKLLYGGSYYSNFREYYEAQEAREGRQQTISAAPLELIEQIIARATAGREAGDWLDVGGGLGTVAELVRRRCPDWRVALNEFNPRSVELAREIYGLDVLSSSALELSESNRRFDVISIIQVLEHITDPLSFLRSYADLLKPDGMMVAVLPQFTRLNAAVSKAASPTVTPPFHVSLFRDENLRKIFNRVGAFKAVEVRQFGPPAFSLLHHYDVSEYWDISIPTSDQPIPKGLLIKAYPPEISAGLNALAEADRILGAHFNNVDGSLYLMAFACKQIESWQETPAAMSRPDPDTGSQVSNDESRPISAPSAMEYPGVNPWHPTMLVYDDVSRQHQNCTADITRLNSIVAEQNELHAAEIGRHRDEIARMDAVQKIYTGEVERLNEILIDRQNGCTAEIERLNKILVDCQKQYTAEIERLNEILIDRQKSYAGEIGRLQAVICEIRYHPRLRIVRELIRVLRSLAGRRDGSSDTR
jgi:SAM-dependent methyltransferase